MKFYSFFLLIVFFPSCSKIICEKSEILPKETNSSLVKEIFGWNLKTSGVLKNLIATEFRSERLGFISGSAGAVYKTLDSGNSYIDISPGIAYDSYGLDFINDSVGFVIMTLGNSDGKIFKTQNKGESWIELSCDPHIWRTVYFLNDNIGLVGGAEQYGNSNGAGKIYRTANSGLTWDEVNVTNLKAIRSFYFKDNIGFATGNEGFLYRSDDYGVNWNSVNVEYGNENMPSSQIIGISFHFLDKKTGYFISNTAFYNDLFLMKTIDGGISWSRIFIPSDLTSGNHYPKVFFLDYKNGYLIGGKVNGNKSSILKTTDGGVSWSEMNTNYPRLCGATLLDNGIAYLVGLNGTVLKSE